MEVSVEAGPALFSGLFAAIIVGGLAGWLAGKIVRGGGFGFIGNVILGIGGAIVSSWLLPTIGVSFGTGFIGSVFSAMIGAALVLVIIRVLKSV